MKRTAKAKAMAKVCELTGVAGTADALLDVQVTSRHIETCCGPERAHVGLLTCLGLWREALLCSMYACKCWAG